VFLVPCLNEEAVIGNSLRRLLSLPGANFVVLVIDDGSDDRTVEVISGLTDPRILLLSRRAPHARQGKGAALNAGIRYLTGSPLLAGRDLDQVIAVVVDADGRIDSDAMQQVTPVFDDRAVGAVQTGVRINNRFRSTLARMQDMEFVIYTEVFQRGRRHIGSVGLGGNGQFMRLSALLTLGAEPWSRSLAEDLDMGIRLIAAGWRNEYCSAVAVHQQGVEELRRLIRQRSRWFQGHLQSWQKIPLVLRRVRGPARADLLYHITSPAVLLIASLLSASFLVSVANAALEASRGENPASWWLADTYALTFGPSLVFSAVYWSKERAEGLGVARAFLLAHLYVCYGMMWYAAGWWGISRTLRGRTSWAKTDRVAEAALGAPSPSPSPAAAAVPSPAAAAVTTAPGLVRAAAVPVGAPGPAAAAGERPEAGLRAGGGPPRPPAGPGGSRAPGRGRRGRRRVRALAVTAAVAVTAAAVTLTSEALRGSAQQPAWLTAFNGYGSTSVTGSGAGLAVSVAPERAAAASTSHAALVISAKTYGDLALTLRMRTDQQLRTGRSGHPEPWEVAWVLWHYTSNGRFYALTLEPTGWELSKQDPSYPGGERFLASGLTPRFPPGTAYTVGVVQVGDQITVSADGRFLARYTDRSDPYLGGAVGLYAEEARATFDRIAIGQLATGGQ
jgi:1,2-diacylglycerol 3-beta-glucosyltransferase